MCIALKLCLRPKVPNEGRRWISFLASQVRALVSVAAALRYQQCAATEGCEKKTRFRVWVRFKGVVKVTWPL